MVKQGFAVARVLTAIAALGFVGSARMAAAIDFDFENPPYVAGGTIVGQDGWATNGYVLADPFFGGSVNGTVDISTTNPLAGAQSVLYNQTAVLGGNTGASDIGNAGAVVGVEDGTSAVDVTASFLIQSNDNALGAANNGSAGFFLGQGGRSPVIVLLVNAGTTTGDILIGDGGGLPDEGDFIGNDVLEFNVGVDLDGQNYEVSVRNLTAGTPHTPLVGTGPGGRFSFFGGSLADDGDGVTYTLDTSLLFRSGVARVDALSVIGVPEPMTLSLSVLGMGVLGMLRRKRRS
ncbi:MAG: PEP-CTERM sorting domain-containing protein [Pirellulales bacterium]|nr:PEP-CTERM sorting domain-containing protein [Pirellulales bacterium]